MHICFRDLNMKARKNRVLEGCLLVLLMILGICTIGRTQYGCHLTTKLTNNECVKGLGQFIYDQPESEVERTFSSQACRQQNMAPAIVYLEKVEIEHVSVQEKKTSFLLPAITSRNKPITLITVPATSEWLLAVAAPIAAKIRQHNKIPILLAMSPDNLPVQRMLIKQLAPTLNSCTVLTQGLSLPFDQIREHCPVNILSTTSDCAETGLLLAKNFWERTDLVIVGAVGDSEAVILGSALASHLGVPFIPLSGKESLKTISDGLETLGVKRVLLATSRADLDTKSARFFDRETEVLDMAALQKRLIEAIGAGNIRNIILFRVPDEPADKASASWLTPYLSLMREAAVVSCLSSDPLAAEEKAEELIKTYSLKPRTATILADNDSIGMIAAKYETELHEYEVLIEPCSRPAEGWAASIGVGRIPFRELWAASTLVARGIARDYVLGRTEPKILMIANPSDEYSSLPLCETISRATAREFKNFKIHTEEFYGVPCHDQAVRNVVSCSQLIIFEGHITEFSLFEDPSVYPDEESVYGGEWKNEQTDDFVEVEDYVPDQEDNPCSANLPGIETEEVYSDVQLPDKEAYSDWKTPEIYDHDFFDQSLQPIDPCQLEGIPLMILQSCHSLDDSALDILASGAAGVLGSATNIHSSSGSAIVKAFCDGLLYRGDTMGEALRDARNYLLCVSALKAARGHKEQDKVKRVAYSFHLWGDPESRLFNGLPQQPLLEPVLARFAGPDKIHIIVPKKRFPTSRTSKYFLRMFPGSEVAGIVKRLKNRDIRRIAPIYFFRLTVPRDTGPLRYTGIRELNDTTFRAVYLKDSFERFLYVLYFPERDEEGQTFTLQFVN